MTIWPAARHDPANAGAANQELDMGKLDDRRRSRWGETIACRRLEVDGLPGSHVIGHAAAARYAPAVRGASGLVRLGVRSNAECILSVIEATRAGERTDRELQPNLLRLVDPSFLVTAAAAGSGCVAVAKRRLGVA
jgi:hypothetical protein